MVVYIHTYSNNIVSLTADMGPQTHEELDTIVKAWLDAGVVSAPGELIKGEPFLVLTPDNEDVIKREHIKFGMIGSATDTGHASVCYKNVDGQAQRCTATTELLTYQIDLHFCRYGLDRMKRLRRWFTGGSYADVASFINFAYTSASPVRRTSFILDNSRHHKHTMDLTFTWRCESCVDIENVEEINILPCADMPDAFTDQTINRV